jgi:hypothetical protein
LGSCSQRRRTEENRRAQSNTLLLFLIRAAAAVAGIPNVKPIQEAERGTIYCDELCREVELVEGESGARARRACQDPTEDASTALAPLLQMREIRKPPSRCGWLGRQGRQPGEHGKRANRGRSPRVEGDCSWERARLGLPVQAHSRKAPLDVDTETTKSCESEALREAPSTSFPVSKFERFEISRRDLRFCTPCSPSQTKETA